MDVVDEVGHHPRWRETQVVALRRWSVMRKTAWMLTEKKGSEREMGSLPGSFLASSHCAGSL
jgi:hypothetical protein